MRRPYGHWAKSGSALLFLSLLGPFVSVSAWGEEPEALSSMRKVYTEHRDKIEAEQAKAEAESGNQYLRELAQREARTRHAGDMEGWQALRRETERFRATPSIPDRASEQETPVVLEMHDMQRSRFHRIRTEGARRILHLSDQYLRHLHARHVAASRENSAKDAAAFEKEIQRIRDQTAVLQAAIAPPKPVAAQKETARKAKEEEPAAPVADHGYLKLEPGRISGEIVVPGEEKWSYYVYAPASYNPACKYPILYIMSPNGGSPGRMRRYTQGADANNWLLAISRQSRNGFEGWWPAVFHMINHAEANLPVDKSRNRRYVSGFSGGSRCAAMTIGNSKLSFAGILACGAGNPLGNIPASVAAYGLSGSTCYNRGDMARNFQRVGHPDSQLAFFSGGHSWANARNLTYGMTWLNAATLRAARPTDRDLIEEREALEKFVRAQIEKHKEDDPESAYDWARLLSMAQPRRMARGVPEERELMNNPKVKLYARGLEEMNDFVQQRFAGRQSDEGARKQAASVLAKRYAETKLARIFEDWTE